MISPGKEKGGEKEFAERRSLRREFVSRLSGIIHTFEVGEVAVGLQTLGLRQGATDLQVCLAGDGNRKLCL